MEVQELKQRHRAEIDDLKTEVAKLKKDNELLKQDSSMANSDKERLEKTDRDRQLEIEGLNLELASNIKTIYNCLKTFQAASRG